ncbi:MAP kinase-activating death domain protein-like [Lampetra fluviatilis]
MLFVLKRLLDACGLRTDGASRRLPQARILAHREAVWRLLITSTSPTTSTTTSTTYSPSLRRDVGELEAWVERLLRAPVPAAGVARLELLALPPELQAASPIVMASPDPGRLSLVDYRSTCPSSCSGSTSASTCCAASCWSIRWCSSLETTTLCP